MELLDLSGAPNFDFLPGEKGAGIFYWGLAPCSSFHSYSYPVQPRFTPLLLSRLAPDSLHGMGRAPRMSQEKDTQLWTQDPPSEGSSDLHQGVGLFAAGPPGEASAHRKGSEGTDNLSDQPHLVTD